MLLLQPPSGCSSVSVGIEALSGCSSLEARAACPRRARISGDVDGVAIAEAEERTVEMRKIARNIGRIGRQNLAQIGQFEKEKALDLDGYFALEALLRHVKRRVRNCFKLEHLPVPNRN